MTRRRSRCCWRRSGTRRRRSGGRGAALPDLLGACPAVSPYDALDVNDGFERELLDAWWREAARVDPGARPGRGGQAAGARPGQRALNALSGAYEALAARPQWPVEAFVSLGSPLGIRGLIFRPAGPRAA